MSVDSSTLTVNNKQVELVVKDGTIGPSVLDISKLYAQTGMFTYDPGFTSTAACESAITYIDGDAGVLLYRGYPIDQLAEHGDFLETCYLLLTPFWAHAMRADSGRPTPACGSGPGPPRPSQSPDAHPYASAARPRSRL